MSADTSDAELAELLSWDALRAARRGVRRRRAGDVILMAALDELHGASDDPETRSG